MVTRSAGKRRRARVLFAVVLAAAMVAMLGGGRAAALRWRERPSPVTAHLNAITFPSPEVGYIVGDAGTVLKTTDGGDHWDALPPAPDGTSPNGTLNAVFFLDDKLGFVGGPGIWKTTHGGSTWEKVKSPSASSTVRGIAFADAENGVAAEGANIIRTSDGGETWNAPVSGVPANIGTLNAVSLSGPNGVAVGTGGPRALHTTDGGRTWAPANTPIPFGLRGVDVMPDGVTAYAVGDEFFIAKTTDGGRSWVPQVSPGTNVGVLPPNILRVLHAVAFSDEGLTGHAVGANKTILETTDGGVTWTRVVTPDLSVNGTQVGVGPGGQHLHGVAFASPDIRFAVGAWGRILKYDPGDPATPSISVEDIEAEEGGSGPTPFVFTVELSSPAARLVSVNYATEDGTATAGQDYDAASGTLTFASGESEKTVTVEATGDPEIEPDETFYLVLSDPANAVLFNERAKATILNDDDRFISVEDVEMEEGDSGITEVAVEVTLTPASPVEVTVDYQTESESGDPDPATPGEDYEAASGTLIFQPGVTTQTVTVAVTGDTDPEQDETFHLVLSNPTNAIIKKARAKITILNDDETALIAVDDIQIDEGEAGTTSQATFTVRLERTTSGEVTVGYSTVESPDDWKATPGIDYEPLSGRLTFVPGTSALPVTVPIHGNDEVGDYREFFLDLFDQTPNAEIVRSRARAIIVDDDLPPEGEMASAGSRPVAVGGINIWGDPAVGILYEVGTGQTAVWDLETRSVIRILPVGAGPGHRGIAVDEAGHRLFVLNAGSTTEAEPATLTVIDVNAGDPQIVATKPLPSTTSALGSGLRIDGMVSYTTESEQKLYIVADGQRGSGNFQPAGAQVFLIQVDVDNFLAPDWEVTSNSDPQAFWIHYVPSCLASWSESFGSAPPSAVVRKGPYVGLACGTGRSVSAPGHGRSGVARVILDPATGLPTGTEFFSMVGGRGGLRLGSIVDPVSGRLFVDTNQTTWIFGLVSGGWLNNLGEGLHSTALDYRSGRLYFGFNRITDARLPQVPPPLEVSCSGCPSFLSHFGVVDWDRRQVIYVADTRISFIKDGTPPFSPPLEDDPDEATLDIEEVPGLTTRDYIAGTQAYGAKVRWVGGIGGTPVKQEGFADLWGPSISCAPGSPLPPQHCIASYLPSTPTREVTLAAVPTSALSPGEASAKAFGVSTDEATRRETTLGHYWDKLAPGSAPPESHANPLLDQVLAQCIAVGEAKKEVAPDGRSAVVCDHSEGEVEARASYVQATADGAPFDVAAARAFTLSYLDPLRGVVARSVAEVSGVTLGGPGFPGEVHIGKIRSVAESWATGRKKKLEEGELVSGDGFGAEGTLTRDFFDVWVTQQGGDPRQICGSACDPALVVETLNRILGVAMRFTIPEPDPRFIEGSPGGAVAKVVLNPGDVGVASIMEEEPSGRLEVPALAVTLSIDAGRKSRVLVRLAGVMTETTMAITCIWGPNEARTSCNADPGTLPSTLEVFLTDEPDGEGKPLEGGKFSLHQDVDGNGTLDPTVDLPVELPTGGATTCTTGKDGIGDCLFEGLVPGGYILEQSGAPDGFHPIADYPIEILGARAYRVELYNLPAVGFISVKLTDDSEPAKPLAGGVFEVFEDKNADKSLGTGDLKVATCITDANGICLFEETEQSKSILVIDCPAAAEELDLEVLDCAEAASGPLLVAPLGAYLVAQTAAPAEFDTAPGVAFRFDKALQHAALEFVNGLTPIPPTPGAAGTEGTPGTPGTNSFPSGQFEEIVLQQAPPAPAPAVLAAPIPTGIGAVVRKVFAGLQLLLADPAHALRAAALWGFLALPLVLWLRRRWLPHSAGN